MDTSFPWTARRAGRSQLLSAVALGFLTFVAVLSSLVVAAASPARAFYPLAVAVTLGAILRYGWVCFIVPQHHPDDVRLIEQDGRPATQLRYSGTQWVLLLVVTGVPSLALAVGTADLAASRAPGESVWWPEPLLGLAAVFFGSFLFAVVRGCVVRGALVLDQSGIHQRGRASEVSLPWHAVTTVAAVQAGPAPHLLIGCNPGSALKRRYTTRFWRIDRLLDEPVLDVDCMSMALDQHAVRALLTHYIEHPEDRAELGGPSSLSRFNAAPE